MQANSLHLIFSFPLAKMYTNSLMSTLNARKAHFDQSTAATAVSSHGASKLKNGVSSTVSVPTWERGLTGSRQEWGRIISLCRSSCRHSLIHSDLQIESPL